ncbi:hypothetical protein SAICODRAFT_31897 [Saitoella complicata NRRL Y-17804]|nr:uncharacterized protein SAICODRAFT_31897 [Saitoella complicata NRRL Y-17804]ODQ50341.1 hypothetical protein SAICODRAFT_31897 [Saitoella complicata NRRL Y-17804]
MISPDRDTSTNKDDSMDLDLDIEHDDAHVHAHTVGHMSPSSPPSSESDIDLGADEQEHGEREAQFDFGDLDVGQGVGSEESVGLRESASIVSNFGSGEAKLTPTRHSTKSGQSYGQGQQGQGQKQGQGDRKRMEAEMDNLLDKGWRWGLGEGIRADEVEGW